MGSYVCNACKHVPRSLKLTRLGVLDGDRVMNMNRLAAGVSVLLSLWALGDPAFFKAWAGPVVGWLACGLGMVVYSSFEHRSISLRRSMGLVLDVGGATIMLVAGGSATAFIYAVYLWIIIGYGFRFGGIYLLAASLLSLCGFALVIAEDPFWRSHLSLSLGLLTGLAVLPAYSYALIRKLAQARARAVRADRAKTMFLARVSHELRTPLHAIIGSTEVLQRTSLTADQAGMVGTINTAAEGQLSLVKDLLGFSKSEATQEQSLAEEFRLSSLLEKVVAVAAVEGRDKGLLVNSFVTARTPPMLKGDTHRIREVLLNLASNAVKFTAEGSVTISADGVEDGFGGVALRFEVMDTGIGIAPDDVQKVFKLFTQANEGIFDRFGGTGLGLALCEQQVTLMGGCMGVDSVLGSGSTFWVNLDVRAAADGELPLSAGRVSVVADVPGLVSELEKRLSSLPASECSGIVEETAFGVSPAHARVQLLATPVSGLPCREIREQFSTSISLDNSDTEIRRAIQTAALRSATTPGTLLNRSNLPATAAGALEGCRVLVADDNKVNRSVVSKMLAGLGAQAILVNDGEEALAILSDGNVDIALLDVNMPVLDGVETAELYQFAVEEDRRIPVLALTADGSDDIRTRCLKAGMETCLVKPVRMATLSDAIEAALSARGFEARPENLKPAPPSPQLDPRTMSELESLGGPDFLQSLIADFKLDCQASILSIGAAVAGGDLGRFRFETHSICSAAANLGARALQEVCGPLSRVSEDVFRSEGGRLLAQVRRAWDTTCLVLDGQSAASAALERDHGIQRLTG